MSLKTVTVIKGKMKQNVLLSDLPNWEKMGWSVGKKNNQQTKKVEKKRSIFRR